MFHLNRRLRCLLLAGLLPLLLGAWARPMSRHTPDAQALLK
jgi:hypothetical protein